MAGPSPVLGIPEKVWRDTIEHFRGCGAGRRECVVYWVGPAANEMEVDEAVHPRHAATRVSYEISNQWLNTFWIDLARRHRSVRAQVHTHAGLAGHSWTDDHWALVYTPGFLSVVLPYFGLTEVGADQIFVAELDQAGRWLRQPASNRLRLPT